MFLVQFGDDNTHAPSSRPAASPAPVVSSGVDPALLTDRPGHRIKPVTRAVQPVQPRPKPAKFALAERVQLIKKYHDKYLETHNEADKLALVDFVCHGRTPEVQWFLVDAPIVLREDLLAEIEDECFHDSAPRSEAIAIDLVGGKLCLRVSHADIIRASIRVGDLLCPLIQFSPSASRPQDDFMQFPLIEKRS